MPAYHRFVGFAALIIARHAPEQHLMHSILLALALTTFARIPLRLPKARP